MLRQLFLICIFTYGSSYAQTTEKLPKKTRTDVTLLTQHVIRNCSGERQKVDSIYSWITNNIAYDYKITTQTDPINYQGSVETLKSGKGVCNAYVELMQDMLEVAGIESEFIEGYVHDDEPGYNEILYDAGHAWIAIKINDEWSLADPTWDAGYIGRIEKKVKHYPKSWTNEKTFSSDAKREKWEKKITKKKEAFDKKMNERDPYTGQIGFVKFPTQKYYLIHPDTFLVTHLPTIPEWQLRKNTLSIEQFSNVEDSVRIALDSPQGETIEYRMLIDDYTALNFVQKWMYTAQKGNEYNSLNHGVLAVNNYNTVGIYLDSRLGKILKRYPKMQTQPLWSELIPLADSAAFHPVLASKNLKASRKTRTAYYKASFKNEKDTQKAIGKEAQKVDKKFEQLDKKIATADERFGADLKSIDDKLVKYLPYVEKIDVSKVKLESEIDELNAIYLGFDSIIVRVDSIRNSILKFRKNSSQQGFYDAIQNGRFQIDYSNAYVSFFSMGTLDSVAFHDEQAIKFLGLALSIADDSLVHEIQTKEYLAAVNDLDKFVKSKKTVLKTLETEQKIDKALTVERNLQALVCKYLTEARQLTYNSHAYHDYLKNNLRIISKEMDNLNKRWDVLGKSREERDKQLLEELDNEYDRGENLYKLIQKRSKEWKVEMKKRLE